MMVGNVTAYAAVFDREPEGGFTVTFLDLPGSPTAILARRL
jgi:hypothetical protein